MKKTQKPKERREEQRKQEEERRMRPNGTLANVYKGTLALLGEMSQVPDSQKLFGAIVYLLSDKKGERAAMEFVKKVHEKSIDFALSSVLPIGYLPTPKAYLMREAQKRHGAHAKTIYSNTKRLDYLPLGYIMDLVNDPSKLNGEKLDDAFSKHHIELHTSQQVHVNTLNVEDEQTHPFSVQQTACICEGAPIKTFEFYIRTNDRVIIDLLSDEVSHVFTLGKRSSQGYNLFQLTAFGKTESIALTSSPSFLNLGMLLPETIEYCHPNSALTLFSSERRPYTRGGAWDEKENRGWYISFIAPGSVIVLSSVDDLRNAGKSVGAPTATRGEIVFGNAFLYPLEVDNA